MLTEPARAKVNLFLHVVGRRPDGYHLLDSLVVFPQVGDTLGAAAADDLSLTVSGPFAPSLAGETDNLVLRAARRLADAHGIEDGARLILEKTLPVASGIGGGSADAAATLRILARLWGVAVPDDLAIALGADVPVCLRQSQARMGGAGECLAPAPTLPNFGMVLINPGVAVPTPAVFRARSSSGAAFSPPARLPDGWADAAAMAHDLARTHNDLQDAAQSVCPEIATVLTALSSLPGCRLARMSGSGATCFALFDTATIAHHAARSLPQRSWWIWGGAGR